MPEGLFSLLNSPTPEQVRQRIGRVNDESALNRANLAPGRGQVFNAARAGGYLQEAFSKPTAEEERAVKLQGVNQEIQDLSSSGDIDTSDAVNVFEKYSELLSKAGLSAEAAEFSGRAEAMKIKRGETLARLNKASKDANKPNSPLAKLIADRDAAKSPEDRALFNAAIAKAVENEDSAVTIIRRIVNLEKARHKRSKSKEPFNISRFSEENRVMINQIQAIHGQKEFFNRIFDDISDKAQQDELGSKDNPIKIEIGPDGLPVIKQ